MRLLYRLAALGLIAVGWLVRPVSAQVGPFAQADQSWQPATRTLALTTRIQRAVDSMQRLTQPGFAAAQLAAKRQVTRSSGARMAAAVDPCNSYLCKGRTNTAPVATTNTDQSVQVGRAFSYTVNAFTDAETPNSLTYTARLDPADIGLSFNPSTRVISGTPNDFVPVSVTITATDPGNLSASTTFTINVTPPILSSSPLRLEVSASPTVLLTTGTTSLTATASGGKPGPPTQPYSYSFLGPGTITANGNTASVSGLPTGVQTFTVVTADANAATVSGTVSVTVINLVVVTPTRLRVLHQNTDDPLNNIVRPNLQVVNDGGSPVPYSEITLRYWLTVEPFSPLTNLSVYYAQLGTDKVKMKYVALDQPRQGAFGYVEYSFDGSAGNLAANANSGPIETGIGKQDGSNFSETDDYSFANNGSYTANAHITAYRNGQLVWGQEPAVIASQPVVRVYSAAKDGPTTSQIQTQAELRNEGNVPVAVKDLTMRYYFTSDNGQLANVFVDYATIGASNVKATVVKLSTPVGGADSYVELSFPTSTLTLSPLSSLGTVDFRLVRSDYGLFDQNNDYSYAANYGNVGLNNHITAYLNNNLVFGTAPSGAARIAAGEPVAGLSVRVLGNPVTGAQAQVEIRGAEGQAVTLRLVDLQGRMVHEQHIKQAAEVESVSVPVGNSHHVLLQVNTATQQQRIKLLRP